VRVSFLGPEAKKKARNIPPDFDPAMPSWLIIYLIKFKKKFTGQFRTARCLWLALIFMLSLFVKKNCCPWRQHKL